MEQQNKTDLLFREKLDQIEFIPSENAWSEIHNQIRPTQRKGISIYLKIAASVVILLAFFLLFYPAHEGQNNQIASDVSYPAEQAIPTLKIPQVVEEPVQPAVALRKDSNIKQKPNVRPAEKIVQDEPKKNFFEPIQVASLNRIDLNPVLETSIQLKGVDNTAGSKKPVVRITYISAGETGEIDIQKQGNDVSKDNLFDKVWSIAMQTSPVELITDFRDAKDGLIENGFRRN